MKYPTLAALLIANAVVLTSCSRLAPPTRPSGSTQQAPATLVTEVATSAADVTATATPDLTVRTAAPTSKAPVGLSWSNPASFHTTVEHPQMTITLVGLELPSGFPSVTPDPGHLFVAPQLSFFCQLPADSYCQRIGPFELIDSQGTRHSPAIAVSGEGFLSTENIPGGTSMTGSLVFMVPINAAPMILRYVGYQGQEAYFRIE